MSAPNPFPLLFKMLVGLALLTTGALLVSYSPSWLAWSSIGGIALLVAGVVLLVVQIIARNRFSHMAQRLQSHTFRGDPKS